jgi:hypothetical protein
MTFLTKLGRALGLIEYTDYYTVQKNPRTGKYEIYDGDGHAVRAYTRRSDAIRGAERSGLTLV